jgi:hypothetical protein
MTHEQARQTIDEGKLPESIVGASDAVAVILTQSWCPQWTFMNMSINALKDGPDDMNLTVVLYEYDRSPHFHEFMSFKENTFVNWEVPYVRLYRNGRFVGEGNTMPAGRMIQQLRAVPAAG